MGVFETVVIVLYLFSIGYLGYLGYRNTKGSTDYILAGRGIHPFVMALSYGATFISTSAIVGFGGVSALFGMSLLWLVFLNIFVGIFVAFVFLGGPTRRMGHHLGAHTFPELLGRRFQSRAIQLIAGCIIFLFMPLYTTAVLLGGAEFVRVMFHIENFQVALLILALVIGAYVLAGGLKGVMYNDALQGGIMLVGMLILIGLTYWKLGGIGEAHANLTAMVALVPDKLQAIGHRGWTRFPGFGWGDKKFDLWWLMVSTITLGVGIGVLAQPQMAVRFMTVRSKREINRAIAIGGIFILAVPGVAYTVGALSNVYFYEHEELRGKIVRVDKEKGIVTMIPEDALGVSETEVSIPIGPKGRAAEGGVGELDTVRPGLISIARARGQVDQIIPTYIKSAMPRWFGLVFLLTLLSAAMSTLSSQLHAMGTAIGRDVLEQLLPNYKPSDKATVLITRIGILIGLVASIVLASGALRGMIAAATALFFGLCAVSFLPTYMGALFWKRMTRAGALASMVGGFAVSMTWMLFFYKKTAAGMGLCKALTGKDFLIEAPNWPMVDPIVIGLPCSIFFAVAVSLITRPPAGEHVERCFR